MVLEGQDSIEVSYQIYFIDGNKKTFCCYSAFLLQPFED